MPDDRNYKILHLDDEEVLLKMVQAGLQEAGFEAHAMGLKREGLAWIVRNKPDLVITDINAPGLNGLDFLRMLKSDPRTSDTRVMFLTGMNDLKTAIAAMELGALDYLTKPFDFSVLLNAVHRALEMSTPACTPAAWKNRTPRVALSESPGGLLGRLRSELASRGMEVTATASFEELLALPSLPEQDLVVLSNLEPGKSGGMTELVGYLRARYTRMHVLTVCGFAELHHAAGGAERGTGGEPRRLPFDPQALTETIGKLFREG